MNSTPELVRGSVFSGLILKSFPVLGAFVAFTLFNAVDMWYISLLGKDHLVAISFTFPVVNAVFCICYGLTTGAVAVSSKLAGQGSKDKISIFTGHSLLLCLFVVFCFALLGNFTIEPLFGAMGASDTSVALIKEYMQIWYWGMPTLMVPMLLNGTIRSIGNTTLPSSIMILAAFINVGLDPLFIFGWGWFPAMGMKGAAAATVLARFFALITCIYFVRYRYDLLAFGQWNHRSILRSWKLLLNIGIPSTLMQLAYPLAQFYIIWICARYGEFVVAGLGIGFRIQAFILIPINALAVCMMAFAGQNWGARRIDRLEEGVSWSVKYSFTWVSFCFLIIFVFGNTIVSCFTNDIRIMEIAHQFLLVVTWASIGYGVLSNITSLFKGISKPKLFSLITLVHVFGFGLPVLYFVSLQENLSLLYWGILLVDTLGGMFALIVFKKCIRL